MKNWGWLLKTMAGENLLAVIKSKVKVIRIIFFFFEKSTKSMITCDNMMQKKDYKGHKEVSCNEKSKSLLVRNVSFGKSWGTEASRVQHQGKPCDQKRGSSSGNSITLGKTYVI